MSAKSTGGPAFPSADFEQHEYTGMTLRDYFAGKAMQTLIALPEYDSAGWEEAVAKNAYAMADAMLAARER